MVANICRLAIALMMIMQVAMTEVSAKSFKDHISFGNAQFKGRVKDRDYESAKTAALEAFKIAESADDKNIATLLLGRAMDALGDQEAARTEYEKVLKDSEASAERKANAHSSIAELLTNNNEWEAARAELENIYALDVSNRTKNGAQRDVLLVWRKQGKYDELKDAVTKLPEGQKEAWSGRKIYALTQATALLRGADPAGARTCSMRILELPNVEAKEILRALKSTAAIHSAEKEYSDARKRLEQALKIKGLSDTERLLITREIASTYIDASDTVTGRKMLHALAEDHLKNGRVDDYVSAVYDSAQTLINEKEYTAALEMLAKGLAVKDLNNRMKAKILLDMTTAHHGLANFKGETKTLTELLDLEGLNINDYKQARGSAIDAGKNAASTAEKKERALILERALNTLANNTPNITAKDKLILALQAAGTYGLQGDFAMMDTKITDTLKQAKEVALPSQLEAIWDATVFYVNIREYDVGRAMDKRKKVLYDTLKHQNTYSCGFIPSAPLGVGGWTQSDFVKVPKNRESRFQRYPKATEASALIYDVGTVRPTDEDEKDSRTGRDTSFFMAYDIKGWHIYIQTDEPDIEQIMLEEGRRGSALEMFFSPGLERVPYYQWILRLGTGAAHLYPYNTPHRSYRHLKEEPGNIQFETVALETGWGTAIFIPWETLYDKLPFMAENQDTWRFSIMRWGPVSLTWGGRVHETSRWGLINWQSPTTEQRVAILRRLIRRAWWTYTTQKNEAITFWDCPYRGDQEFFEHALKPLIATSDAYKEKMESVAQWDAATVQDVFKNWVPVWMEFGYEVETLREKYLQDKFVPLTQVGN